MRPNIDANKSVRMAGGVRENGKERAKLTKRRRDTMLKANNAVNGDGRYAFDTRTVSLACSLTLHVSHSFVRRLRFGCFSFSVMFFGNNQIGSLIKSE